MIAHGGGRLYYPASTSYYGFNGNPEFLGSYNHPGNIEIFGDGASSEIKHVNPSSGTFTKGSIFATTTYSSNNTTSIFKDSVPRYHIYPAAKGQTYVRLVDVNDTANLFVGKLIVLAARLKIQGSVRLNLRASEQETNKIGRISDDSLFLDAATREAFAADTANPFIVDANAGVTHRFNSGGQIDFMSENIFIHDMALTQADRNLIDNTPLDVQRRPNTIIAFGGTYKSIFLNLHITSYGTFGGNMFTSCDIGYIWIKSNLKVFDYGYASVGNNIHDVDWEYYPSNVEDTSGERSAFYMSDDFHNNNVWNIHAHGGWSGLDIIRSGKGAHDNHFYDWTLDFPNFLDTGTIGANTQAVFNINDDTAYITHDNRFERFFIRVDSISQWMRYDGVSTNDSNNNNVLTEITFAGSIRPLFTHIAIQLLDAGNVTLDNWNIPNGDYITVNGNSGHSTITRMYAPNTRLKIVGTSDFLPFQLNNVFLSSESGSPTYITPSFDPPTIPKQGYVYFDSTLGAAYIYYEGVFRQFDNSLNGSYSESLTAQDTVTVTFGITLHDDDFTVSIAPRSPLAETPYHLIANTTTTFSIVFDTPLTGNVRFDWQVLPLTIIGSP